MTRLLNTKRTKPEGCPDDFVQDLRREAAYVEVPAGKYPVGEKGGKYTLKRPILIARYPTTNSQFELFIQEGGYDNQGFWSQPGWASKDRKTEPKYWQDSRWNKPNHPVVGVSWYEAEAFCNWAEGRLPDEFEWEAAARGADGLEYPWGNEWKDGICNTNEAGVGKTSPVGQFPRSRSKDFGLEDMSGNVWEWCAGLWNPDRLFRVLRGGAWSTVSRGVRASYRSRFAPVNRDLYIGFRVVRDAVSRTR